MCEHSRNRELERLGGQCDGGGLTSLADQVCIEGWGKGNFAGLCKFTCSLGYCPVGACVCSKMGPQPKMPKSTGIQGYPTAGESPSYSGLCSFACNYGNCIEGVCVTVEVPLIIPTVSHFTPDTCTAGTGSGALAGLCSYGCNVGYCPIHNYTCTATDPLNLPALRVFPPPETIVDCATLPASEVTVPILRALTTQMRLPAARQATGRIPRALRPPAATSAESSQRWTRWRQRSTPWSPHALIFTRLTAC